LRTIRAEIQQYMAGPAREGAALRARFQFPPEFIGFQGHFPQKKILPGVCQIQLVLSMLEKETLKQIALKEVVLAKYFSPVFPDEEIVCVIGDIGNGAGEHVLKAAISKGAAKVAELKLKVVLAGGKKA